jgi:hypothetical protein
MPVPTVMLGVTAGLLVVGTLPAQGSSARDEEEIPPRAVLLRLDAGLFSQGGPFDDIVAAVGASAGLEWEGRRAVLLRVLRHTEDPSPQMGKDPMARTVTALVLELARWPSEPYAQQFRLRAGLGAMWRGDLAPAPLATVGVAIRYEVARRLAFVGVIEDDVAWLPWEELQACEPAVCRTIVAGGYTQHNLAGVVSLEWRP